MFKKYDKVLVSFGFYKSEGTVEKMVKRDHKNPIFLVDVQGEKLWIEGDMLESDNS